MSDGLLILLWLILADLPFALQAIDMEVDAHNVAEQLSGEIARCVSDAPWMSLRGLVLISQPGDDLLYLLWLADGLKRAVRMNYCVVPGGDDFAGVVLCGVPVG